MRASKKRKAHRNPRPTTRVKRRQNKADHSRDNESFLQSHTDTLPLTVNKTTTESSSMKPVSGTVTYFNASDSIQVLFYFYVEQGKSYTLQLTQDGITYADAFTFTAPAQMKNFSHTVTPVTGAYWPRMIENA